jgi:hypothetical protein
MYEVQFWEVRRIIRGYRKRNKLTNQLLAESIYATIHIMRDPQGKTPSDMFPQLFKNDADEDENSPLTDEDAINFQKELDAINSQQKKAEE